MTGSSEELKMDMSPMIDMVFLLLMFFLVNAQMIVVKLDDRVKPPIAKNTIPAKVKNGRIVVNIFEDGVFATEDGEILQEDDILDYIKKEKELNDGRGYTSKLHLRGHKAVVFRYCRKVIRIAAHAGVDQVIFAAYQVE
jgi:biopolymer transport protein ExbD